LVLSTLTTFFKGVQLHVNSTTFLLQLPFLYFLAFCIS